MIHALQQSSSATEASLKQEIAKTKADLLAEIAHKSPSATQPPALDRPIDNAELNNLKA